MSRRTIGGLGVAAVVLLLLGMALWALAVLGVVLESYVALRPILFHPVLFASLGCAAFATMWAVAIRPPLLRWLGLAALVGITLVVGGVGWFVMQFESNDHELSRSASPDGVMDVVVYSSSQAFSIDPYTVLQVETRRGWRSREVRLGCINHDYENFEGVEWVGDRTVRVDLGRGETVDITVNERGRPDQTVGSC